MSKDEYYFSYTTGDAPPKFSPNKKGKNQENKKYQAPKDGFLRIQLEKNKRGGKTVCVIYGFSSQDDLENLCSEIKKKSGTGGALKDNRIEIQGDKRDQIEKILADKGYKTKRVGG
ncbi:MAG: translation initiation factor [Spirochaetes bacterium]|nr:translation initiation factor [Spirochaetota bacterium]